MFINIYIIFRQPFQTLKKICGVTNHSLLLALLWVNSKVGFVMSKGQFVFFSQFCKCQYTNLGSI